MSFSKYYGESSYTVYSNNSLNLKSKLDFPFEFYSVDLNYKHNFEYFTFGASSSFLLNDKTTSGKDYDWQNDNLTVFSKSDNEVDKYYDIGIEISKYLFDDIGLFIKFNYQFLDMSWLNTYQEDYVKNENEHTSDQTLKYQQEFYNYYAGFNYKKNISNELLLVIKPSLVYSFINTKDTHLLRDFYTTQNINTLGYELILELYYKISFHSDIKISFSYIKIEEEDIDMDYYTMYDKKYMSYPSIYNYEKYIISIGYKYRF